MREHWVKNSYDKSYLLLYLGASLAGGGSFIPAGIHLLTILTG